MRIWNSPVVDRCRRLALAIPLAAACSAPDASGPQEPDLGASTQSLVTAQKLTELAAVRVNDHSAARGFTKVGAQALFFTSLPGFYGSAGGLYRTDGTPAGTQLVRDLEPLASFSTPPRITAVGAVGYWFRDRALWRSDGTPTGTSIVRTFGQDGTRPLALGDAVYFGTGFGAAAILWRSDGTAAGTTQLAALEASSNGQVLGDKLYFGCATAATGRELCVTDGTTAGTSILKELVPGIQGGDPVFMGVLGTRLLFSAVELTSSSLYLRGLWSTDGTSAGTIRLIAPAPNGDVVSSARERIAALGGFAYFPCYTQATGSELCKTDGTTDGTSVLDTVAGASSSGISAVEALGDQLLLSNSSAAAGRELWRSNGTVAGTQLLRDLAPGAMDGLGSSLVRVGGAVYFSARTTFDGHLDLWKTDGTAAGTTLVKAILPAGKPERYLLTLSEALAVGDKLVFTADDGATESEPWASDGTAAGTVLLQDVIPARTEVTTLATRGFLGAQYLSIASFPLGSTDGVWRTDGTATGSKSLHPGQLIEFAAMGPWLYYLAKNDLGATALWRTDGATDRVPPATDKVRDLPGSGSELVALPDRLAFAGTTPNQAVGLWLSDGTTVGTALADTSPLNARRLRLANGRLWLTGLYGALGNELWTSDGSPTGTAPVADIRVGNGSSEPGGFVALGPATLFAANDGVSGVELWRTDGTAAGTTRVLDLLPGAGSSGPRDLLSWKNLVLFTATDSAAGPRSLWRTDGTAAGTARIKALPVTGPMVAWGDYVFFAATDAQGSELWRTDGTEAGTVMVTNQPGPMSATPEALTLMAPSGPLVFAADDSATGRELWKLSQPLAAPELVFDLAPGPRSSRPFSLSVQGRALLLTADTGAGNALWRLDDVGGDGTAPVLTCPVPFIKRTLDGAGAVVTFPTLSVVDDSGRPPVVTLDPPSGRKLPLGLTTVKVTATDGANNVSRCTFSVEVQLGPDEPPPPPPGPDPDPDPRPGDEAGGCSTGPSPAAALPLALGALLVLRRRRRPRVG